VTPDVLVPRPETECLVEAALGVMNDRHRGPAMRVLDLGTGSGAIAVSLARERGDLELWATEISPAALEVARLNALRHGVCERISFLAGDLFGPVQELRKWFHLLISNPPYLTRSEMDDLPPEVGEWEPRMALCGGSDGLDFYRRIIQEGPLYLAGKGIMALEIGADMAEAVSGLFAAAGRFSAPGVYQDLAGRDRVVVAQLES
jgi:release factor glutamine methyltransferase